MSRRRGFKSPLGNYQLPRPITENETQLCLKMLRNSVIPEVRLRIRNRMIKGFMRLGFSLVANRAAEQYKETDILVSVMFEEMIEALDAVKNGDISHDNVGGYLVLRIKGKLSRALRPLPKILVERKWTDKDRKCELDELCEKAVKSEMDQKILYFKLKGYTDLEVSEIMGLSRQKVGRVFTEICARFKELYDL